ncbi:hypothetical protein KCMC57_up59220 [Kitasatospora sp. CMC57]|uniref:Lipoprotein n=1 Tax=Kitasatospora sp. CMC57 TaxID=3231513 RepID=A0AB33K7T6_9ACTN
MPKSTAVLRASLLSAAAALALAALTACDPGSTVPSGAPSAAPAVTPTGSGSTPACGAPADAQWVYVSSAARTSDGTTTLGVAPTRVTCSSEGLDPQVEGTGVEARAVTVTADAGVQLLTPGKQLLAGTPADLPKLFAAHAAGQDSTGGFGWHGNIYTIRLNAAGQITFVGQGPWSSLNTAPPQ